MYVKPTGPLHVWGFDQWSSRGSQCVDSLLRQTVIETETQNKARGERTQKLNGTLKRYCSSLSYNKAWSGGASESLLCITRERKKKTNYLELSTIYCTILSRTFSKRAVRTQMCLMAWADRGWGGRLVVEEPCLLRGSWPMLWVLLQDTKHNIISDCYYREDVMFVFVAWWTSDFWVWYWNEC